MVVLECIVVAAIKSEAATNMEYVGSVAATTMYDSESFLCVFEKDLLP